MKRKIKEIGTALLLPGAIITAMYIEKLLEIITEKVPIEIITIVVMIVLYKIIKTTLKIEKKLERR